MKKKTKGAKKKIAKQDARPIRLTVKKKKAKGAKKKQPKNPVFWSALKGLTTPESIERGKAAAAPRLSAKILKELRKLNLNQDYDRRLTAGPSCYAGIIPRPGGASRTSPRSYIRQKILSARLGSTEKVCLIN